MEEQASGALCPGFIVNLSTSVRRWVRTESNGDTNAKRQIDWDTLSFLFVCFCSFCRVELTRKGFSHWVTRGHLFVLMSKILPLGAMLNFDADVKKKKKDVKRFSHW